MADQEHLRVLRQGVEQWNTWREEHPEARPDLSEIYLYRADLSGADLSRTDLSGTNLIEADLREADLRGANLSGTHLRGANLRDAYLFKADLSFANLSNADLSGANLILANLSYAALSGANLTHSSMARTLLGELDLRDVIGLETIIHRGPSHVSINTLYISEGHIPEAFVRGTGAPDSFIDYMPALTNQPIQYYTCFISYSGKNQDFAQRLYADLQSNGVRCWYAPEDLKWGTRTGQGIDEAIRLHDKFLLILSKDALASKWVEREVNAALQRERREKKTVLFPVRLDNAIEDCPFSWATEIRRERNIGNFTQWKRSHDNYQKAFQRLLRDLKASR